MKVLPIRGQFFDYLGGNTVAQEEYFSCMGCGLVFKLTDEEILEYGLHDCTGAFEPGDNYSDFDSGYTLPPSP